MSNNIDVFLYIEHIRIIRNNCSYIHAAVISKKVRNYFDVKAKYVTVTQYVKWVNVFENASVTIEDVYNALTPKDTNNVH